ncbi:FUSC family protein [Raineyella antarctica]|uniref:FUSC family protein n=1 Tax=Raineyella antarctica TaxID=1577474 RepID=UPI0015881F3C|nr:FUSC family protein [Raineyella antarctica]
MSDNPLRLRNLFTLGPAATDPWVSLRCGLGIFLPLLALILLHRLDLAVFAIFAAFTNVYGRVPGHTDRLLAQLKVGGTFWAMMLAAWLSSRYLLDYSSDRGLWLLVSLTAVVSGLMTAWAAFLRIRPAGSLFHIFCFATIAAHPVTAPLGDGMFVASATIGFALLLGQAGRLWNRHRTPWTVTTPVPLSAVERREAWLSTALHVVAVMTAGAIAIAITPQIGAGHRYWALVAAVVPLVGHTTRHRIARGIHRILGTTMGLAVLAVIMWWGPPTWMVVLLMGAAQYGTELLVNRNYFFAQTFVTPMALLGSALGKPLTPALLYDRITETLIGATVGMTAVVLLSRAQKRMERRRTGT